MIQSARRGKRGQRERAVGGRLAGKTALITAAGQGIGTATRCWRWPAEGAQVRRDRRQSEALLEPCTRGQRHHDARARRARRRRRSRRTIDELPPLDVLFNCAGFVHNGTILDCAPKDWDFSFNLNVRAMYMTIQCALPKMLDAVRADGQGASIINMASVAGSLKGLPNRFVYGASKAAVVGLTKAVAADFVQQGHPLQRDRAGDRRYAVARASGSARSPDPVEARKMLRRAPADGPPREARGDRADRRLLASDESAFATGNVYSCRRRHDDLKAGKHRQRLPPLTLDLDQETIMKLVRYGPPARKSPA